MTMPLTKAQAYSAVKWIKGNYGSQIDPAVAGTPFSVDLLCGIACQESAYFWLSFIGTLKPSEILGRCVLDASGDYPGTKRSAFPKNTSSFRAKFGDAATEVLIAEANLTRVMRGFSPAKWVYKGYGIFQYDLQHVKSDPDFFFQKRWYDFDACLARAVSELRTKYAIHKDVWKAVRAYNGSGPSATEYANNVVQFAAYAAEVK